jgi:serine/threonine-protein kinase
LPLALVIDDEEDIRALVSLLLKQAGWEVVDAADGVEGIARLEESLPDFVVLDVEMPRLDGWQTLMGIRSRSDVPVLMLTPEDAEEDNIRGLLEDADDYMTKPLKPADFVARVETFLRRISQQASPPRPPGEATDDEVLPPGTDIGSYRIDSIIGRGGMSAVYRATNTELDRVVALKLLGREMARDPATRERFMNEWRIAASLRHPNVLAVHDAGEVDGRLFLAMDLIEGGDLGDEIERDGALMPARAVALLEQIASALDAAHAAGLVHRDVKPGNVLLDGERAYLTDFGLSKLLASNARLTKPGRMVGTAAYLAPEQIRGEVIDARTDVYALGCVFFEALTASSPFEGESGYTLMYAHLERPVPPLTDRRPELSAAVDEVVRRAMAKLPADRYDSAGEAVAALKAAFGYE